MHTVQLPQAEDVKREKNTHDVPQRKAAHGKAGAPITRLCTLQSTYKLESTDTIHKWLMSTVHSIIPSTANL
jgi:hypothetical protein